MSDTYERGNFPTDDGREWGFVEEGAWIRLPKIPMLLAELGPPPFSVRLPDGRVRHVLHDPGAIMPGSQHNPDAC